MSTTEQKLAGEVAPHAGARIETSRGGERD